MKQIVRFIEILILTAMITTSGCVSSGLQIADPKSSFTADYPTLPIETIEASDIDGLYEVVAGGNVFYYHPVTGNILVGEMLTKKRTNITAERRRQLQAGRLKNLPLDKAIRVGSGKNIVYEFTDPDCPFCRKAAEFLDKREDVSRYIFLFPIESLHPAAEKKALAILCSNNPAAMLKEVMKGDFDNKPLPSCEDDKQARDLLALYKQHGQKLGIQGTPALWINGQAVAGANFPVIERLLSQTALKGVDPVTRN